MSDEAEQARQFDAFVRAIHDAQSPRAVLDQFLAGVRQIHGPFTYVELVVEGLPDHDTPGRYLVTRLLHHSGTEFVPDHSPFRRGPSMPVHRGGFLGRIVAAEPRVIRDELVSLSPDDPFADALRGHAAYIAVPILSAGEPEWAVLLGVRPNFYRDVNPADFLLKANLMGVALQSMHAAEQLRLAQQKSRAEVERIAAIQRALLPTDLPEHHGFEIAYSVEPSDCAGGDLVDIADLDGQLLGMLIADASGHGPSAAVVAAMISTIVRAYPQPLGDPAAGPVQYLSDIADVLDFANDHLCEKRIDQNFVTAWVAAYERKTGTLHCASAGHPHPLLCRRGCVQTLPGRAGLPLGIFPQQSYASAHIPLEPGDLVLAYTDGISEAVNPDGEFFGVERIADLLPRCHSAQHAVDTVRRAVEAFSQGNPRADDQTLLAFRIT